MALPRSFSIDSRLLLIAKRMTLLPTPLRVALLPECRALCDEFLTLLDKSRQNYHFLSEAVETLYKSCETLASLQSDEDHSDGEGTCPICGNTSMIRVFNEKKLFGCVPCLRPFLIARKQLGSLEGMGFCFL